MSPQLRQQAEQARVSANYRGVARAGYAIVVLTFGVLGIWTAKAPLDSAAVAQGQIEVESRRKPIQHLEGGIIREILVKEAQFVKEGQVLFRLEPIQARANVDMLRKQRDSALAEDGRLLAERDGKSAIVFSGELLKRAANPDTAQAILDEERQFLERRQSLESQLRVLQTRVEQAQYDIIGRTRQESAIAAQVDSLTSEIARVSSLEEQGLYPTNKLSALQRDRMRLGGELGQTRADIERLRKQQDESRAQIEQILQKFREDAGQRLGETRARLSDVREKLAIAGDVLTRVEIRAAVTGIVQNLHVSGPGTVIKAGDTIAELVPASEQLVVAAQVSPLDVDSVAVGQKAEVRFISLSRRQTPIVFGRVESISADALTNETTKQAYYLARVVVDRSDMPATMAARLTPGMPADVMIVTGERSLLQYLIDPLTTAFAKGMRED
jgi:HlyD family secretion protein